jgi:HTH-type transcriptional regulator, transcriptional repressor of NAD biosynthesis genes
MRGIVFGKFYPPHEGHHYVIDRALSECSQVIVLVWGHPSEEQSLTRQERVALLRDRHPSDKVVWLDAETSLEVDYSSRRHDRMHAQALAGIVDSNDLQRPHRLYGSEPYVERLAEDLGIEPAVVDLRRVARRISSTRFRQDPAAHWDWIAPGTKAHLTKRVVVCGAESSGTTTLAKSLAKRYETVWVPEWGRAFSEAVGPGHRWSSADFELIAREQQRQEDMLARYAGPVMFCDTDAYSTAMFHELYMHGRAPEPVWLAARDHGASLYVVTDDEGVMFEDDGSRLFEPHRKWATEWFERELPADRTVVVRGTHEQRMDAAAQAVERVLRWDFAPPGDAGARR